MVHTNASLHKVSSFESRDRLLESNGMYGRSDVIRYQFPEGVGSVFEERKGNFSPPRRDTTPELEELDKWDYEHSQFGEGLAIRNDEMLLLTWRRRVVNILPVSGSVRQPDREIVRKYRVPHEGWGICFSNFHGLFVVTSGESKLYLYSDVESVEAQPDQDTGRRLRTHTHGASRATSTQRIGVPRRRSRLRLRQRLANDAHHQNPNQQWRNHPRLEHGLFAHFQ